MSFINPEKKDYKVMKGSFKCYDCGNNTFVFLLTNNTRAMCEDCRAIYDFPESLIAEMKEQPL